MIRAPVNPDLFRWARERNECRHFGRWLTRLEELPPLREDN